MSDYKVATKNGTLVVHSQEVRKILYSETLKSALLELGGDIQRGLGDGYSSKVFYGHDRVSVIVGADSKEAVNDNLQNNTLLKAVGK